MFLLSGMDATALCSVREQYTQFTGGRMDRIDDDGDGEEEEEEEEEEEMEEGARILPESIKKSAHV